MIRLALLLLFVPGVAWAQGGATNPVYDTFTAGRDTAHGGTANNQVTITGGTTGQPVKIIAGGALSDSNVSIDLEPKGTGTITVNGAPLAVTPISVPNGHIAAGTSTPGALGDGGVLPAGALVGTTDTQTLTNKTLTSPTISGGTITGTVAGSPALSGTWNFTGLFQVGGITEAFPASTFIVGTTDVQTLTNKTLTSPAINGATLGGTLAGSPTFSGTVNFSGPFQIGGAAETFPASAILVGTTDAQTLTGKTLTSPTINAGALSGTFTGSPTLSGNPTLSGTVNVTGPFEIGGTAQTFPGSGVLVGTTDTQTLSGKTLTSPVVNGGSVSGATVNNSAIGGVTPSTAAFTTLSASSTVSGTGFSAYLASPPAIGGTAPASGSFTSLNASATANFTGPFEISGAVQSFPASGTLVGATDSQTLSGKTLTSPTINAGALSGTFSGNPTLSGAVNFTGSLKVGGTTEAFPASGALVGTSDAQTLTSKTLTSPAINSATVSGGTIDAAPIGGVTPSTGAFTTLAASGAVSGTGFTAYLASPPPIGGTLPAAGTFTALTASGTANFTGPFQIGGVGETFPGSGLLVGTTDTQTLAGKTLTSPTINGAALSGTVSGTPTFSGDVTMGGSGIALAFTGTGSVQIPAGTTGQRPDTGNTGELRYNSTTGRYEFGLSGSWVNHVRLTGDTMTGALAMGGNLLSGSNVSFTGGSIDNTTIGAATKSTGAFTGVTVIPSTAATAISVQGSNIVASGTRINALGVAVTTSGFENGQEMAGVSSINTSHVNTGDNAANTKSDGIFARVDADPANFASYGQFVGLSAVANINSALPYAENVTSPAGLFAAGKWLAASGARGTRGWPLLAYVGSNPSNLGSHPETTNSGAVVGANIEAFATNATALDTIEGGEIDIVSAGTSTVVSKVGFRVADLSTILVDGTYDSAAIDIVGSATLGAGNWRNLLQFGSPNADWPLASTGTIISAQPRIYGGGPSYPVQATWGLDFRQVAFQSGGASIAVPNAGISPTGALYASGITSNGTVQAQTATLTGVTIVDGGYYTAIPTFTVATPPSGGTRATGVVTMMAGRGIVRFGATGRNFQVGDVLQPAGGQGFVGTLPSFTAASVDGNGGVTGWTVSNPGAITKVGGNPIALTGGSGTGALVDIGYNSAGATGLFTPMAIEPAATGSGFAVNDVLTISGDTGTAVQVQVTGVTSDGGILPGLTVQTAGSVTAVAGGTYHSATGGSGTGASLQVGYTITGTNITNAGAGYLPVPAPVISPSVDSIGALQANLLAVMTSASGTLALNPGGGAIQGGSGAWTANGSTSLSLTNIAPAGAHATVQEWFTVKNASGVTRYIPAF